jgi:hypothetical protein
LTEAANPASPVHPERGLVLLHPDLLPANLPLVSRLTQLHLRLTRDHVFLAPVADFSFVGRNLSEVPRKRGCQRGRAATLLPASAEETRSASSVKEERFIKSHCRDPEGDSKQQCHEHYSERVNHDTPSGVTGLCSDG